MIKKGNMLILAVIMIFVGFNGTVIAETIQKTDNSQEQSNLEEQTPSLEETMRWIKGKIEDKSHLSFFYEEKSDLKALLLGTNKFNYDGCNVSVGYETLLHYQDGHSNDLTAYSQFNLKDMSAVTIEEFNNWLYVILETLNSGKLVRHKSTSVHYKMFKEEPDAIKTEYEDFRASIGFELDLSDKALAKRLVKAFNHAMLLCGGKKKEPF